MLRTVFKIWSIIVKQWCKSVRNDQQMMEIDQIFAKEKAKKLYRVVYKHYFSTQVNIHTHVGTGSFLFPLMQGTTFVY